MVSDPAELAFGHALAMLGDPDAASEVATVALRRAGRARGLVLAHARHEAVSRATEDPPVDLASIQAMVMDLPALAATLASTRPAEERAALDLRARTSGDLAALGEAFGTRPTAASDRCNDIAESWEASLDPALLAFSGPGDCEGLAEVLSGHDLDTVADLVAVAPAARAHAEDCTVCSDRLRAMASVRGFFSDTNAEVPPPVREVSRVSRTKRPSAKPPPLFPSDALARKRRQPLTPMRLTAGLVAVGVATAGVAYAASRDSAPGALTRLTRLSKTDALSIAAPAVTGEVATVAVQNPTDKAITYRAKTSVKWASVSPLRGVIEPRGSTNLVLQALGTAPEGNDRATLVVTTGSGASTEQEVMWTLEHPPDLDANATGCSVEVNVVEEGKLTSLVLHWRDTADHEVDITNGAEGYEADLTPNGAPITYWVTAVDERGNHARTADQVIAADAC
ncbi:MAG: hypothetical protein H0U92_11040 [Actinobacteria bacterium]|nr:hypothetical protein [Actinomycetota bacterium]